MSKVGARDDEDVSDGSGGCALSLKLRVSPSRSSARRSSFDAFAPRRIRLKSAFMALITDRRLDVAQGWLSVKSQVADGSLKL